MESGFFIFNARPGSRKRIIRMNAFNLLAVGLCAAFTTVVVAAENSGEAERKRPRKEVTRAEPPAKTEMEPAAELCNEAGNVRYTAVWEKGKLTLTATGSHKTAGYRVFFEQSMLMIYPPQFSLKHRPSPGSSATVVTPFSVQTSFKADEKPTAITVYDAKRKNQVPVR